MKPRRSTTFSALVLALLGCGAPPERLPDPEPAVTWAQPAAPLAEHAIQRDPGRLRPRSEVIDGARSPSRQGWFRGNTYVNDYFGFSIDLPSGWTLPDRSTRRAIATIMAPHVFSDPAAQQSLIESVDSNPDGGLNLFSCTSDQFGGATIQLGEELARLYANGDYATADFKYWVEIGKLEEQQEMLRRAERLPVFERTQEVRVLHSCPDQSLRGLRAIVFARNDQQYSVCLQPTVVKNEGLVLNQRWIGAEHLAAVGSREEVADLADHPELQRAIAEQDARIEAGEAWNRELESRPPIREGDAVRINDAEPRPALRGRTGKVVDVTLPSFDASGGVLRFGPRDYDVLLSPSPGSARGTVRVNGQYLEHAPR